MNLLQELTIMTLYAKLVFFSLKCSGQLSDILCERYKRIVGHDNCVNFEELKLQIPADRYRCHYVKAKVTVL